MRTVKRISLPLNAGKWEQLEALVSRYAQEKQAHLSYYLQGETFAVPPSDRVRRDELVKAGYISPVGLQARAWKLALKDAHETVVKWWAVWSEEIRSRIHKLDWTETQRHYAYWLLYAEPRLAQLILGRAPLNEKIKLTLTQRQAVTSYLRRTLRKLRGKYPQVKQVRSLALDANMYTVRPNTHIQVIEVAGLVAGQRIPLVLRGHTTIKGNLRLILDRTTRGVAIHTGFELQAAPLTGEMAATDAGLTEAFTDEKGNRYGTELGVTLVKASDQLCDKGRKRNKLHVVRKKALARGDLAKAARIQAHNLGRRTQQRTTKKLQLTVARIINHGINELVNTRQMGELVTEKLDLRGPTKSKSLARQVSLWHRSILNDRLDFKASAKGFSRQEVNPAYSSQLCPICGYLDRRNRVGDAFQCLNCGHAAPSDQTASVNLKARAADPAIQVWTPHPTVKQILLKRYQARLESRTPSLRNETLTTVTVTGQTSDTELTTPVQRRRRANARLEGNDAVPVRPSKNETAVDNKAKPAAQECNDYVQLRFW